MMNYELIKSLKKEWMMVQGFLTYLWIHSDERTTLTLRKSLFNKLLYEYGFIENKLVVRVCLFPWYDLMIYIYSIGILSYH